MPAMFRNRWWVVFASGVGLVVGAGAYNIFGFGVFLVPVTSDLHIERRIFADALLAGAVAAGIAAPILGFLLDWFGVRRVLIPGIILYAVAYAAHSLITTDPLFVIYLLGAFAGFFGVVQSPIPYAAALTKWFDRNRGLALGIALAGVGVGVAVVPKVAAFLIFHLGWRWAYVGMGLFMLLLAWVPVALFVREPTPEEESRILHQRITGELPGMTARQAVLGSWRFWALNFAFFLGTVAINGTLTHVVPLQLDQKVPIQEAASAMSYAGGALILGRILSGWCLDRIHGSFVAIAFFAVPIFGILALLNGMATVGATLCGLSIGAELDFMSFFISRYFGLKAFGKISGWMFILFAVANGMGPAIADRAFDWTHSYAPAFWLFEGALVLTCLLMLPLGPYPYPARGRDGMGRRLPASAEAARG